MEPNQNNEKDKKDSKHLWDKVIMGAVVGGAIGSVLGASIAPKKGKETREDIAQVAKTAKGKFSRFFGFFKKLLKRKNKEEAKKIPTESSSPEEHNISNRK